MTIFRRSVCFAACLAVVLFTSACKKGPDPQLNVNAETAIQDAEQAMGSGDYAAALSSFDIALAGGVLSPDQYARALTNRAECNTRLGDFAKAHADLDEASRGADMAQVHRARSFLLAKEGNSAGSRSELNAAKRINPKIKAIQD